MPTPNSQGTRQKSRKKIRDRRVSYVNQDRAPDLDLRVQYITSFWCQVEDPASHDIVFVNPVTGECRWELEPGTYCLPQDPTGMWWEIEDEKNGGVCYYFNTKTKATTWNRPGKGEGLVIPLSALQASGASRRFSQFLALDSEQHQKVQESTLSDVAETDTTASPPASPVSSAQGPSMSSPPLTMSFSPQKQRSLPKSQTTDTMDSFSTARDSFDSHDTFTASNIDRTPATLQNESQRGAFQSFESPTKSRVGHERSKSWTQQIFKDQSPFRKSQAPAKTPTQSTPNSKSVSFQNANSHRKEPSLPSIHVPHSLPTTPLQEHAVPPVPPISPIHLPSSSASMSTPSTSSQTDNRMLTPVRNPRQRTQSAETGQLTPLEGRPSPRLTASAEPCSRVKRFSTEEHQALSNDAKAKLKDFAFSNDLGKHFAQRKAGLFSRKQVPMEQLAAWQRAPLTQPLRSLDRKHTSEALKAFKLIQCIMGDRDRSLSGRQPGTNNINRPAEDPLGVLNTPWSPQTVENARNLTAIGIKQGQLRDEIYMQLIKQLTRRDGNPSMQALIRGWQLFQVVVCAFPPSRDLETTVKLFFQNTTSSPPEHSDILRLIAVHCNEQLDKQVLRGPRGRLLNKKEILIRSMNAFNPRSYGESLEYAQHLQEVAHSEVPIPLAVILLCNSLLSLGGMRTEGIFRISADSDSLNELKASVDEAGLHVDSAYDVHTVAGALKIYFRDLPQPLIPTEIYSECLLAAGHINIIHGLLNKMPLLHRRVLAFIVTFLQMFTDPDAVAKTRMPAQSLAMVWAPNVLRCENKSMCVAFSNAPHEQTFFYTLLKGFDPANIDLEGFQPVHPYPVPVGPFQLKSPAMDLVVSS